MSNLIQQQALVRLLTDTRIRQSIARGDLSLLTDLGLTIEQAQSLSNIDAQRLELFADMIIGSRINDTAERLPFTAQLLGPRLQQICVDFNHELLPEYSKKHDHALAFARFLMKHFSRQPPSPPFLQDVLTYEMTALELFVSYDNTLELSRIPTAMIAPQIYDSSALFSVVPYRLSHNRVIALNYDVPAIVKEMIEGRTPTVPLKQSMYILLRVNALGSLDQDKINTPTVAFIEACGDDKSLGEIVEELASNFQQHDPHLFPCFKGGCLSLCQSLVERGVIGLTSHMAVS